jgi:rare lipoprotein A (peptidoglycan hydrolase)
VLSPHSRSPHRRIVVLVLAVALAMMPAVPAAAAPSVADKQAEAAKARDAMRRMQTDLAAGMTDYVQVSGRLASTRAEIAANSKRLGTLQARLKTLDTRLAGRADFMYRTSDASALDMLFGASTFEDFLQRLDLLSRIALQDASLIAEAKSARIESTAIQAKLRTRESDLVGLRDKTAAQRDRMASQLATQRAYFRSISSDVAAMIAAQVRAERPAPTQSQSGSGGSGGYSGSGNGLAAATVEGRTGSYYVMADEPRRYRPSGVGMTCEASEYGVADNGTGTSSGRPLSDSELTCAHKTLPFGTRVAVTHAGRRVIVVVTDRGPFAPPGRDLDLTHRAASLLGLDGVGNVHYEVVVPAS